MACESHQAACHPRHHHPESFPQPVAFDLTVSVVSFSDKNQTHFDDEHCWPFLPNFESDQSNGLSWNVTERLCHGDLVQWQQYPHHHHQSNMAQWIDSTGVSSRNATPMEMYQNDSFRLHSLLCCLDASWAGGGGCESKQSNEFIEENRVAPRQIPETRSTNKHTSRVTHSIIRGGREDVIQIRDHESTDETWRATSAS